MDEVRAIRVYEFSGPGEAMEKQLKGSLQDGIHELPTGITIKVVTVRFSGARFKGFPGMEEEVVDGQGEA